MRISAARRVPTGQHSGRGFPNVYGYDHPEMRLCHDTVIPRLIYPAPLEPGSQAAVGLTSTAMGDLAGISGAVSFWCLGNAFVPCCRLATRAAVHGPSEKAGSHQTLQRVLCSDCWLCLP